MYPVKRGSSFLLDDRFVSFIYTLDPSLVPRGVRTPTVVVGSRENKNKTILTQQLVCAKLNTWQFVRYVKTPLYFERYLLYFRHQKEGHLSLILYLCYKNLSKVLSKLINFTYETVISRHRESKNTSS